MMAEGGPSAARIGGLVRGQIDQFVNGLTPADIVGAVNPGDAAAALNRARQAWATYAKSNDVDEAVAKAQDRAGRAVFPDANIDKLTRDAIAKVRDSRSNWTPDELAALNEASAGTPTQRALRMVGALAPHSPLTALLHAGGLIGGVATGGLGTAGSLGTMATGLAARKAADYLTQRAAGNLSNLVRSGGVGAPAVNYGPAVRTPLTAALLGLGVNAAQPPEYSPAGVGAVFAQ